MKNIKYFLTDIFKTFLILSAFIIGIIIAGRLIITAISTSTGITTRECPYNRPYELQEEANRIRPSGCRAPS